MALELFSKKFMDAASRWYQKSVGHELNKMGKVFCEERVDRKKKHQNGNLRLDDEGLQLFTIFCFFGIVDS
jgi:hypothetical protein